jgi:hypothetical protein
MRSISRILTGAVLTLAAWTAPAAATPLPSTVTADCVGGALGCSQVDFFFAPASGSATLDFFQIFLGGSAWTFSADQSGEAEDAWGPNVFSAFVAPGGQSLLASFDLFAAEVAPQLRLRAQFLDSGLTDTKSLAFRYEAGQAGAVLYSGQVGAPSTVTPEPASMVLMASGLLGVVGVGVRRRRAAA